MEASSQRTHKVHEVSGLTRITLSVVGFLLRMWQATLRYEIPPEVVSMFTEKPGGTLLLIWHNRIFPGTGVLRRLDLGGKPLHALISASKDGAQVSHFVRGLGLVPVRGSSSRRASGAARELLKLLENGNHVVITVDGPRGPRYQVQPGAALLIQQTGVTANLVNVECQSCWELNSWDRFLIPLPFSKVVLKADRYAHPNPTGGKDERTAIQQSIQEKLDRLTEDRHCRQ